MKVKIGDEIYNSEKQPIMIIMSNEEKELISSMDGNDYRFCSYPENENPDNIKEFMKEEGMSDLLKRKGKFKISKDLLMNKPEEVLDTLKGILILRVDNDFVTDTLTYWGYSKNFDIFEFGAEVPNYTAEIHTLHGDTGVISIEVDWIKD